MANTNEKEVREFIKEVEKLKEVDYINFIKMKSFINGILVGKEQAKVNI